ncbi:predicted protein [Sclerotinia sclerotiorum 1980 UF-70]|uniref:Uncharacterized protein n=1 Tax=Sclerotinia sclerotiorum (strain ATCC 18683 / 1980 / Ss-1) TaxID=665079 RepID=A7E831_SCLS1|nr:predicted protein [Sclerotinia sclerotiorum 1980 UF-70]EDN96533.1 predicted protein [Sclerotinia sclerotiorum 1980 UF-70]
MAADFRVPKVPKSYAEALWPFSVTLHAWLELKVLKQFTRKVDNVEIDTFWVEDGSGGYGDYPIPSASSATILRMESKGKILINGIKLARITLLNNKYQQDSSNQTSERGV